MTKEALFRAISIFITDTRVQRYDAGYEQGKRDMKKQCAKLADEWKDDYYGAGGDIAEAIKSLK